MLCVYYQLKFQIQFEKFDPIWKVSNQIAKPASTAKLPLQSCLSKSIPIKEKEFTMDLACVFSYSISRLRLWNWLFNFRQIRHKPTREPMANKHIGLTN